MAPPNHITKTGQEPAVAAWLSHIAWIPYTTMGTAWPSSGPYLMCVWPYPFRGLRWRHFSV
jgi:hypothetical protein